MLWTFIAHMIVSLNHDYTCHAPTKYPSFSFKSRSCTFGVGKFNVLAFFKAQSVESSSVKWSRSK